MGRVVEEGGEGVEVIGIEVLIEEEWDEELVIRRGGDIMNRWEERGEGGGEGVLNWIGGVDVLEVGGGVEVIEDCVGDVRIGRVKREGGWDDGVVIGMGGEDVEGEWFVGGGVGVMR